MFPLLQFRNRKTGTRAEASFFTPDFRWDTVILESVDTTPVKILPFDPTRIAMVVNILGPGPTSLHWKFIIDRKPIFYTQSEQNFFTLTWDDLGALVGNEWFVQFPAIGGVICITHVSFRPKGCPTPDNGG